MAPLTPYLRGLRPNPTDFDYAHPEDWSLEERARYMGLAGAPHRPGLEALLAQAKRYKLEAERGARRAVLTEGRRYTSQDALTVCLDPLLTRSVWEALAPAGWPEDPGRTFLALGSPSDLLPGRAWDGALPPRASDRWTYDRWALPLTEAPPLLETAVALAADPAGVLAAEALAQEAGARLAALGLLRPHAPPTWLGTSAYESYGDGSFGCFTPEFRSLTLLLAVQARHALEVQEDEAGRSAWRAWEDRINARPSNAAERPWWRLNQRLMNMAMLWRYASLAGTRFDPDHAWPALRGRRPGDLPSPYEPLLALGALGYWLVDYRMDHAILATPWALRPLSASSFNVLANALGDHMHRYRPPG